MKRIKLVVSYDGTNYCGWQMQPRGVSVEAVLNEKLSGLLREEIAVIGASRTDSGVHALGNIAVFDTETRIPADKICMALNQRLPEDIVIQSSCEVPLPWHPRKCNTRKTYEYKILNRKIPLPCLRRYAYFYYMPLNAEHMAEAAGHLVGEHDFSSFCSSRSQAEDTVREIYSLDVSQEGEVITIRICGNGFLYNMVRIIVGTLLRVGTGMYPPGHMKEILEARNRQAAGPKAPPEGLTLVSIEEETELEPVVQRKNGRWDYKLVQKEIAPKGHAYLLLRSCGEEDYDRTVLRLTKQCVRNGARQVHLADFTGRVFDGRKFDYFTYRHEGGMWLLSRPVPDRREATGELEPLLLTRETGKLYLDVYNRSFREVPVGATYGQEDIERLLEAPESEAFLLRAGGETVGFSEWLHEDGRLELEGVGILPEFRGKGYGKEALQLFFQGAAERNYREVALVCAEHNRTAWKLYESLGFQKEKLLSEWYVTEDEKKNQQENFEKND